MVLVEEGYDAWYMNPINVSIFNLTKGSRPVIERSFLGPCLSPSYPQAWVKSIDLWRTGGGLPRSAKAGQSSQ